MAQNTILIPVGFDRETDEWCAQVGLRLPDGCGRYPKLGVVRAAARGTEPMELSESLGDGRWQCQLSFGPLTVNAHGGRVFRGGGLEVNATIDPARAADSTVVESVGFRGGEQARIDGVADAIAAVTGPVITLNASIMEPRLHLGG